MSNNLARIGTSWPSRNRMVSTAPADGYTLFLITGGLAINKALYNTLNYDLERDFAPVISVGSVLQIIGVHPSLPVKSIAGLIAFAKSRPGQVGYASAGTGSVEHIAGEMLGSMGGVRHRRGAVAPDIDADEQEQPHHVDEMPVPGGEFEAEMLLW